MTLHLYFAPVQRDSTEAFEEKSIRYLHDSKGSKALQLLIVHCYKG